MFVPCIIRRSRNNQHYALNFTTALFYRMIHTYILVLIYFQLFSLRTLCSRNLHFTFLPSCTCSSHYTFLPYFTHTTSCCYCVIQFALSYMRSYTYQFLYMLYILDIPPIRFIFKVTQKDLRSSLMMAGYCRNM
jgi:hypothetical protein